MKKLLVAAIVVLMASPAFAAIQNVKVSGDITSTFLDRQNFDLGLTSNGVPTGLKDQNVFITQTRLRVDADLSDNVSTTVGLINERAWGNESTDWQSANPNETGDTTVALYLANVTLRELLYSPLTVTVGRQVFYYGNGLILGNGPNNLASGSLKYVAQDLTMRTAEDGIKAVLDYKPLTIDLIYFKNSQYLTNGNANSDHSSSDVYGINANYQLSDPWNTVVEAYLFNRINGNDSSGTGITTSNKGDTLYVPGLRASTNPIKGLNVQAELAWQAGNHPVGAAGNTTVAEHREAMAAQLLATYSLPVLQKYKPTVNASYTYVSGDKNGNVNYSQDAVKSAKVYTAWDPMFDSQGAGTIYNTLYPLSNMHILALGASADPLEDVNVAATWSSLWAADRYSSAQNPLALYQPDNGTTTIAPATNTNTKKHGLGNEYDVNLTYNYTEDVTFGVSLGWYVPGSVFADSNKDIASQAIVDLGVKF